jgi:lipoprotein-releasing system permease protein
VLGALYLPDLLSFLEQAMGFKALDADVYFIDYLPSEVETWQVAVICLTAMVIALLATFYPANKAAKLRPIELID